MWKDVSSFSQRDAKREPRTFQLSAGHLKIVVTRHVHYDPDEWVLSCEPFVSGMVVSKGTADEAKAAAIVIVRNLLNEALQGLSA